jgi:acylphosphatase
MRIARRYVVRGRVQGVGFRAFVQQAAAREGTTGWVCNRFDGSVEAWIEGEVEAVGRVEAAIRTGPRHADVARVTVDSQTPAGGDEPFRITSGPL